jgi:dihydropteroate synthase
MDRDMDNSNTRIWRCGDRVFVCGTRTIIVGILNVTPDSFSDGGRYATLPDAVVQARRMVAEGADMIDIGGESTRPGAPPVSEEEELHRVIPAIEAIRAECDIPLSIDTRKAAVAREALARGAQVVNDVSALTGDPGMLDAVAQSNAGVVLMHMQGIPETMQNHPNYADVVEEVALYLERRIADAVAAGVGLDRIAVDPGIGFGKTLEHNLALLTAGNRFHRLGTVVYIGASRKSFIGRLLGDVPPENRLEGSVAAAVASVLHGADIVRVHDVAATRRALAVADALRRNSY